MPKTNYMIKNGSKFLVFNIYEKEFTPDDIDLFAVSSDLGIDLPQVYESSAIGTIFSELGTAQEIVKHLEEMTDYDKLKIVALYSK